MAADLLDASMETGRPPKADVTGMLFVRDAADRPQVDGRRLVMVVGVLAVPADADLPGEHQFVVAGSDLPDTIRLNLMKDQRVDLGREARGLRAGDLLLQPVWRT